MGTSHLDDIVSEVREAGRHAFRKNPAIRARFASTYLRRRGRRSTDEASADSVASSTTEE